MSQVELVDLTEFRRRRGCHLNAERLRDVRAGDCVDVSVAYKRSTYTAARVRVTEVFGAWPNSCFHGVVEYCFREVHGHDCICEERIGFLPAHVTAWHPAPPAGWERDRKELAELLHNTICDFINCRTGEVPPNMVEATLREMLESPLPLPEPEERPVDALEEPAAW